MEIERKWMVNGWPEGENFPALPLKEEFAMRQGYISVRPTVRIREDDRDAILPERFNEVGRGQAFCPAVS